MKASRKYGEDFLSVEVLTRARRAEILTSVYIVRSDEVQAVSQAANQFWKQVVPNTPRTVKELLPTLMGRLIESLADATKQRAAARCVGELVGKLDKVLPSLMPIF